MQDAWENFLYTCNSEGFWFQTWFPELEFTRWSVSGFCFFACMHACIELKLNWNWIIHKSDCFSCDVHTRGCRRRTSCNNNMMKWQSNQIKNPRKKVSKKGASCTLDVFVTSQDESLELTWQINCASKPVFMHVSEKTNQSSSTLAKIHIHPFEAILSGVGLDLRFRRQDQECSIVPMHLESILLHIHICFIGFIPNFEKKVFYPVLYRMVSC